MFDEADTDARLLALSGAKRPCKHAHCTLVHDQGVIDDLYYDYHAWQCDDCGMVTLQDVTQADIAKHPPAKLDKEAYLRALAHTFQLALDLPAENADVKAQQFFNMAVKRGRATNSSRERQLR